MKWHLTEKELPEDNSVVLIYVPDRPWIFSGKGDIHYKVAIFNKGISKKEREQLSDNDFRKREYRPEDECFNNLRPYCFKEFGPDSFFGQEVKAWAYIDEYEGK